MDAETLIHTLLLIREQAEDDEQADAAVDAFLAELKGKSDG